jgi:hypothetical protein
MTKRTTFHFFQVVRTYGQPLLGMTMFSKCFFFILFTLDYNKPTASATSLLPICFFQRATISTSFLYEASLPQKGRAYKKLTSLRPYILKKLSLQKSLHFLLFLSQILKSGMNIRQHMMNVHSSLFCFLKLVQNGSPNLIGSIITKAMVVIMDIRRGQDVLNEWDKWMDMSICLLSVKHTEHIL